MAAIYDPWFGTVLPQAAGSFRSYGNKLRLKTIPQFHLIFNFIFMAGILPGITSMCMLARYRKLPAAYTKSLAVMVSLPLLAWLADIAEISWLLHWIAHAHSPDGFALFRWIVAFKWLLLNAGMLRAIVGLLWPAKKNAL